MQIKPSEIALTPAPASVRPAAVSGLTLAAAPLLARDNVSISEAVRTLAIALTQALPDTDSARLYEVLTPADRRLVAHAVALARTEGSDASQVRGLVLDLYVYRASLERVAGSVELTPEGAQARARGSLLALPWTPREQAALASRPLLLALPRFSAQDEAVARSILSSLALRDTALDHGFVRALLDPDRQPTHALDFAFLRRLVVALSPAHADGTLEASSSFARREARGALAEALEMLGLTARDLPEPTLEAAAQSRTLLRERLTQLLREPAAPEPEGEALALPESLAALDPKRELVRLSRADRTLLGVLYVAAKQRGMDLSAVDEVARRLVTLRKAEQAELSKLGLPRPSLLPTPRQASLAPSMRPLADREHAVLGEPVPAPRSYGSSSQLAAKLAGTYQSLVPPSPHYDPSSAKSVEPAALPLAALLAQAQTQTEGSALQPLPLPTLTRPLDLTQALGLSALLGQLRAQTRSARRPRLRVPSKPELTVHAIEALPRSASEAEADDPVFSGSRRRESMRWQLLVRRRQKRRGARAR